jgi:XTP/dITP diphosphohydrolase
VGQKVYLLTGNPDKVRSARKAFEGTDIELKQLDEDYPEIQAESSLKIARNTVKQAMNEYDRPVIREDHSVYLDAVPGFPGPYMSYFDKKMPAESLIQLLEGEDRTGYFEIAAVLGLPKGEIKEYEFKVPIEISDEIKGDERNWDGVMMLEGEDETFAESSEKSRLDVWNQNYRRIAEVLAEET